MLTQALPSLFKRDLTRLRSEMEAYTNEADIWIVEKKIANSAGNLCLHLIGNLNAYIGKELGGTGYERNRPLEFSQQPIPRSELMQKIDATLAMIEATLQNLTEADLEKEYPVLVYETKMTTGLFLMYLPTHLAYHLGQINYHRRLLAN
jgi:uncharacterized damage-inducible protein DinB